jgi:hypothetical protein
MKIMPNKKGIVNANASVMMPGHIAPRTRVVFTGIDEFPSQWTIKIIGDESALDLHEFLARFTVDGSHQLGDSRIALNKNEHCHKSRDAQDNAQNETDHE